MLVILYKRGENASKNGVQPISSYYYSLDDRQQNLFNPFTLTISWGKHPEGGCRKQYIFKNLVEKNIFIRKILGQKLRTYKVLYSYFKDRHEAKNIDFPQDTGTHRDGGLLGEA